MAVEMGYLPPSAHDGPTLEDTSSSSIVEHVQTSYGSIKISIYGDRSRHPLVTFHDIGMDADNMFQNFFQFGTAAEFADKFCVYNINAPGQEIDAHPFPEDYVFPTMESLASIVANVVDHYGFPAFIGFGVGAGANVMLRYALEHQQKLDALILVNCSCQRAGWVEWGYQKVNINYLRSQRMTAFTIDYLIWHHFGNHVQESNPDIVRQYRAYFNHHPNPTNMAAFIEAYLNRSAISISRDGASGPKLNVPVIQFVGARSPFIEETVVVNTKLDPAKSDWIKVSDSCGLVLDDKPERITEALLLFLQGLGFFPTLNVHDLVRRMESWSVNGGNMTTTTTLCDNINECANEIEAAL